MKPDSIIDGRKKKIDICTACNWFLAIDEKVTPIAKLAIIKKKVVKSNNEILPTIGILKKNLVEFKPPLPKEKLQAISNLGNGLMNKIFLEFSECFWGENVGSFGIACQERGKYSWFYSLKPVYDKNILVCFVTDFFAQKVEKLQDKEIID